MTNDEYMTRARLRQLENAAADRERANAVVTPAFRRWAYGVAVAAVAVAVFVGWLPLPASAVVLPLIMAILYVDKSGAALDPPSS